MKKGQTMVRLAIKKGQTMARLVWASLKAGDTVTFTVAGSRLSLGGRTTTVPFSSLSEFASFVKTMLGVTPETPHESIGFHGERFYLNFGVLTLDADFGRLFVSFKAKS